MYQQFKIKLLLLQLKRLLCHLRQNKKFDDSGHYESEERRLTRSRSWEASRESEVRINEYLEPELNWERAVFPHFQICDEESKRGAPSTIDLSELSKSLEEHKLQVIAVEDWILIQRASFDVLIAEEPYHSIQIYVNLRTNKHVVRVWGISIKSGDSLTTKDLQELCIYCFKKSAACVGYLGFPPGDREELVRVNFPRTRWISRSCEVAYPKSQGSFTIGLCPACSGETVNGAVRETVSGTVSGKDKKRKEERMESDQTVDSEDNRLDSQLNLKEDHDDANLLQYDKTGGLKRQDAKVGNPKITCRVTRQVDY